MLFMLNWNKRFTIIESLLGIGYVYTYKSEGLKDISYRIEGYLILISLIIKFIKHSYEIYGEHRRLKEKTKKNISNIQNKADIPRKEGTGSKSLPNCSICTCEMTNVSATKCGHLYCWDCIIKYL